MRELKADRLLREIAELQAELRKHQERCKHPHPSFEHKGDTGNWCPQDDSYWKEWYCPTCKKAWIEDL